MYTLHHRAILSAYESMEEDGTLISDGHGMLVPAQDMSPLRFCFLVIQRVGHRPTPQFHNIELTS